jgi:hypothetical protein
VQGGDKPRASALPAEPHVVAEINACVAPATTESGAGGDSEVTVDAADCCGSRGIGKGRLSP